MLLFLILMASQSYCIGQFESTFCQDFAQVWERHKTYSLQIVDAMPEEGFYFKPSDSTRSFSEIIIHIIQSNYGFASIINGNQINPELLNINNSSKSDLYKNLANSFEYTKDILMKVKDEHLVETIPWTNPLEQSTIRTKKEVLHIMREHAAHHRGAMTVYLRLNGIMPPPFID